jgi:hypothetical protein
MRVAMTMVMVTVTMIASERAEAKPIQNSRDHSATSLKVFADGLEFLQWLVPVANVRSDGMLFKAIVDVVVNQGFLGLCDSFLNGVELLGDVEARTALLDHGDRRAKGDLPLGEVA